MRKRVKYAANAAIGSTVTLTRLGQFKERRIKKTGVNLLFYNKTPNDCQMREKMRGNDDTNLRKRR